MSAKLLQLCLTLWDLVDCSLPGSSVHGIRQARILEWIEMPSSKESSKPGIKPVSPCVSFMHAQLFNCVRLFAIPWTLVCQVPLSMGFSRQEYESGCHFLLQEISWPRDQTHVSCTGRWILYHCATWVYSRDKMDNISDICNPMGGIEYV